MFPIGSGMTVLTRARPAVPRRRRGEVDIVASWGAAISAPRKTRDTTSAARAKQRQRLRDSMNVNQPLQSPRQRQRRKITAVARTKAKDSIQSAQRKLENTEKSGGAQPGAAVPQPRSRLGDTKNANREIGVARAWLQLQLRRAGETQALLWLFLGFVVLGLGARVFWQLDGFAGWRAVWGGAEILDRPTDGKAQVASDG